MPLRVPWGNFPDIISHSNEASVRAMNSFAAATLGDISSALSLADSIFDPRKTYPPFDFVAPVIELSNNRRHHRPNYVPIALSLFIAQATGSKIVVDVVQANFLHREGPTKIQLVTQPFFTGNPPQGRYLIVDGIVSLGSAIANLRGYLTSANCSVVAATSAATELFGSRLAPSPSLLENIKNRFPNADSILPAAFGFPIDCLTSREAYTVYGLANLNGYRNRVAQRISIS